MSPLRALLVLLLAFPLAASAQYYTVDPVTETVTIAWPEAAPAWRMEVIRPGNSSSTDGSGLELRNVSYNGRQVFKVAHLPVVNVEYDEGSGFGCSCYRDWSDFEARFLTAPEANDAIFVDAEPGSVRTTCDFAGEIDPLLDQGDLRGIAAEDFGDRLVVTTQYAAGWYRYRVQWVFHLDGRMQPSYAFGHTPNVCTQFGRNHHAYWRFDFDIGGDDGELAADGDYIVESAPTGSFTFDTEARRNHGSGVEWSVYDRNSGRGYRLTPGPEQEMPVDDFAYADAIVLRYKPTELDDGGGFSGTFCAIDFESPGPPDPQNGGMQKPPLLDGDSVLDTDIVLWYRTGTRRTDEGDTSCRILGPTLTPVGNWAVSNENKAPSLPSTAALSAAYPNPFDRVTTVRFRVDEARPVTLTLVDGLGRTVRTLYTGTPVPGQEVEAQVTADGLPSGSYTVRLTGEGVNETTRVVLLR
ncbi:MAG: T9SS type A sorting domain-containing protein [Bacteroidota bacterium]